MDNRPETPETMDTRRYLDLLAAQLHALPPDVQAEQCEEVRQHLQAMVAACRELGSGAEAAEREAREQFGDPVQVGKSIARRYSPPGVLPGSFALAFGVALVWLTGLYGTFLGAIFLFDNWYRSVSADAGQLYSAPSPDWLLYLLCCTLPPLIAGVLTGLAAPKYAVPAVAASVPLLWFGFSIGCYGLSPDSIIVCSEAGIPIGAFSAWIVSRLILRRSIAPLLPRFRKISQ